MTAAEVALAAAAAAVAAALLGVAVRRADGAFGAALSAAACAVLGTGAVACAAETAAWVLGLSGRLGLPEGTFETVLRVGGIGLLTGLSGEICRGAGAPAEAAVLETVGTAAAALASLPLWDAVIRLLESMLV